jgi:single-stranded DNA-specific DHH superfamily exonuclease
MKAASINEIKKNLEKRDFNELLEYCIRLTKFKKENKELLAFLLFDSGDIPSYIDGVKEEMNDQFNGINKSNIYFIKKSVRKILRLVNKHIRFSLSKQTEAELLIHFCNCIITYSIPIKKSRQLMNLYENQLRKIDESLGSLHPDLQYDLRRQMLE